MAKQAAPASARPVTPPRTITVRDHDRPHQIVIDLDGEEPRVLAYVDRETRDEATGRAIAAAARRAVRPSTLPPDVLAAIQVLETWAAALPETP